MTASLGKEQREHGEILLARLRSKIGLTRPGQTHGATGTSFFINTSLADAEGLGVAVYGEAHHALRDLVSLLAAFHKHQISESAIQAQVLTAIYTVVSANEWKLPIGEAPTLDEILKACRSIEPKPRMHLLPLMGAANGGIVLRLLGLTIVSPTVQGIRDGIAATGWPGGVFERVWAEGPDPDWLHSLGAIDGFCLSAGVGDSSASYDFARATARNHLGIINLILERAGYWGSCFTLAEDDIAAFLRVLSLGEKDYGVSSWGAGRALGAVGRGSLKRSPMPHEALTKALAAPTVRSVDELFATVIAERASKYERQLARMWVWLGRAHIARDPSERLLNSVIALEAGLCTAEEEKIATALAQHSSILLHDDPEERLAMVKRIKAWYGRRCGIVHMGGDHPSQTDADEALNTGVRLANRLTRLRGRWAKIEDLRRELQERLLGKMVDWESS